MVRIIWQGGEHEFALRIGELRALQEVCDVGPELLLQRITSGAWRVDELLQTVRFGLIGGGMEADAASKLITKVQTEGLLLLKIPAQAVLVDALTGTADDELPDIESTVTKKKVETGNGDLAKSTEQVP